MVNDLPDSVRFRKLMGDQIALAAKATKAKHPRIAACGEMAPTLWAQGRADAAIQVEQVTDEIAKTCDVDILCGYVLTGSNANRKATSTRESVQNTRPFVSNELAIKRP